MITILTLRNPIILWAYLSHLPHSRFPHHHSYSHLPRRSLHVLSEVLIIGLFTSNTDIVIIFKSNIQVLDPFRFSVFRGEELMSTYRTGVVVS